MFYIGKCLIVICALYHLIFHTQTVMKLRLEQRTRCTRESIVRRFLGFLLGLHSSCDLWQLQLAHDWLYGNKLLTSASLVPDSHILFWTTLDARNKSVAKRGSTFEGLNLPLDQETIALPLSLEKGEDRTVCHLWTFLSKLPIGSMVHIQLKSSFEADVWCQRPR